LLWKLSVRATQTTGQRRSLFTVGLVVINVQQPLTIAAAAAGVAPTMCTHPRCQRLAATIVEEELEELPWMPINRGIH